jgi:hypothetical protein
MKPKGPASREDSSLSVETYGGDYHRLESTFVLPAKYRRMAKQTTAKNADASKRAKPKH